MEDDGGFESRPAQTGHRPLKILNNEDLPQPFGPVISRCMPASICRNVWRADSVSGQERQNKVASHVNAKVNTVSALQQVAVRMTLQPQQLLPGN